MKRGGKLEEVFQDGGSLVVAVYLGNWRIRSYYLGGNLRLASASKGETKTKVLLKIGIPQVLSTRKGKKGEKREMESSKSSPKVERNYTLRRRELPLLTQG